MSAMPQAKDRPTQLPMCFTLTGKRARPWPTTTTASRGSSLGEMRVPADAYYGAQTQRAVENFPISGLTFQRRFVRALGVVIRCSTKRSPVRLAEFCSAAFDEA